MAALLGRAAPALRRCATPLRAAVGRARERELLRVRLAFSDADWGEGEAAPLEPYDGVPMAVGAAALQAYQSILTTPIRRVPHDVLLAACWAERACAPALAAIDLALWDRAGRREGKPVAALLGASVAEVAVNATIGASDRAGAAAEAAAAAAAGFGCVKVKVGVGDDAGRLAAVRAAAGPDGHPRGRQRRVGDGRAGRGEPARARAGGARAVRGARPRRRGAARGARRLARADRDGRDGRRAGGGGVQSHRRRLPQDRPQRRDHGAAARRPGRAGGRGRRLRGVELRRAAGDRRRGPRRRGARAAAALRARDAGGIRGACRERRACCARGGAIAVPRGPGLLGVA